MRAIIIVLWCILVASCATSSQSGQNSANWQGRNVSELTAKLGSPVLTNVRPNGNATYTYVSKSVKAYSSPLNSQIATVALPHGQVIGVPAPVQNTNSSSTLVECIVTYEANKSGVIIGVKKQGEGC
jgi:hypothetical protein